MSHRNNDKQGRFRSKVIAFRVSPQENSVLERKVFLSGLTKQDYLIHCMENKDYIVLGNPYVYRSLKREMVHFIQLFEQIESLDDLELDELEILKMMLEITISMKRKKEQKIKASNRTI